MSASKDKINRKQLREAGQDKHQLAQQQAEAERRKTRTKYIIIGVIVVLLFAFIFLYNSSLPSRYLTGATIDGREYSVAELNYYYSSSYQTFYSTYGQYIQYGLFFDTSKSLADQDYSEDQTWREYFLDQALANMKQVQALCDAGEAAGFELSEEYQTQYDEAVSELETSWQTNGYSSLAQFLNMVYGKGVDEALVKQEMYRGLYASAYAEHVYDSYEYTPEELSDYYTENADKFDFINYATYTVIPDEDDDGSSKTAMETMVSELDGTDEDSFAAYVSEHYDGDEIKTSSTQGESLSESYSEWLLDSGRKAGDCTLIDTDNTLYAVMFLGRENNQYATRTFRHILIKAADEDGDDVTSAEEIQAAVDRAEEIYDEWKSGDATEDSFAELANEYSDDTGSNTTGGLYEDVYKNQMVAPVNDWLFAATEPGETGVVEYNEGGSYAGGHVLYYVGEGDTTYADELADSDLRTTTATEWIEELTGAMTATRSNTGIAAKNY